MTARRIMGTEVEYGISVPGDPTANPVITSTQVVLAYAAAADIPRSRRARWEASLHSRRTTEGRKMALFVIERNFAEQLDAETMDYAGIRLVNDDAGVRWLYSFLSADKKKTYCLYEAANPEAIAEAAKRLGIPADVIVAVEEFGPEAAHR